MENIIADLREKNANLVIGKLKDYGPSWRILRPISFVDQMMIKIKRLRTIQEPGYVMQVDEPQEDAFIALHNYALMALINYELGHVDDITGENVDNLISAFKMHSHEAHLLQLKKDQDYGSAWLNLSVETITDLIMQKLMRAVQIIKNNGNTEVSEGIAGSYYDIANYAIFALYKLMPESSKIVENTMNTINNFSSIIDHALAEKNGIKVDEKMNDIIDDIKKVFVSEQEYYTYWTEHLSKLGFVLHSNHGPDNQEFDYICEVSEYKFFVKINILLKTPAMFVVYSIKGLGIKLDEFNVSTTEQLDKGLDKYLKF